MLSNESSITLLFTLHKMTFVLLSYLITQCTFSFIFRFFPFTFIIYTWRIFHSSLTLIITITKISNIDLSTWPCHFTFSIYVITLPLTFINASINILIYSLTFKIIFIKLSFIDLSIIIFILTKSLKKTILKRASVFISIS